MILKTVSKLSWVLFWNTFHSTIQPTRAAFTYSKSTLETWEQRINSIQSSQQELWTYFITCCSVSIPDFKQVNTSWVLKASFTHRTNVFFVY